MRMTWAVAAVAAAATAAGASGQGAAAPLSLLYADRADVAVITDPAGPGPAITGDRGVFRQDPGHGGMLDPAGRDAAFRVAKVSDHDLEALDPRQMADLIIARSDRPEVPNSTGIVTVDEVGNSFNDGKVGHSYKWVTVRGKRYRISSHNRIVITRTGWRLVRGTAKLPAVRATSLGARFSEAMRLLAETPHPAGGTYAERVHLYLAPAFVSSIAVGRGPHRHLGNDGKPHRATWRGVMPAVARAGGVWLQMYHFDRRTLGTMSAQLWRRAPQAFLGYGGRFGMRADRLHLVFSGATNRPAGAPAGCGDAMACQWQLARSTSAGRAVLGNGVGAYRPGALAATWRNEFNRTFP